MKTVNIMEVRTAVAFMKPFVGLIFFVINNSLRFLLLIDIIIISLVIENTLNPIGKSDKIHNNKKDKYKYLIFKAFEKFNGILSYTYH